MLLREVLLTILKGRLFPMKVIKKNQNPMKMKMLPAHWHSKIFGLPVAIMT